MEKSKKITFCVLNEDIKDRCGNFYPKEVTQKSYTDKIGEQIIYCGELKTITNVIITDEKIIIELD